MYIEFELRRISTILRIDSTRVRHLSLSFLFVPGQDLVLSHNVFPNELLEFDYSGCRLARLATFRLTNEIRRL
jgi:hypothetical protein